MSAVRCSTLGAAELEPPTSLKSTDQKLSAKLFVQFHDITLDTLGEIWTRAYGLTSPAVKGEQPIIPGPTFYIQPGDLFHVDLRNDLSEKRYPDLLEYETLIPVTASPSSKDDVAKNIVHHEVNIPHNPNNTNLHVHGLHVAPSRDDVTIVVVPEGTSQEEADKYAQPSKFLGHLSEKSVSDRPVQIGQWQYYYRIPDFHLPGTHWYHSHKHGSTALQTENGMAGTIVMGQGSALDPLTSVQSKGAVPDRVMILQALLNYGLNFGKGESANLDTKNLNLTLNGQTQPTLSVAPNQLERWRMINATANHANLSYVWVGGTNDQGKTYESVPVHAIAVDGVTMSKLVKITAESPLLMAPGNRVDLLVQLDGKHQDYALIKNVPDGTSKIDGKDVKTNVAMQNLSLGPLVNPYAFEDSDKILKAQPSKPPRRFSNTAARNLTGDQQLVPVLRVKKIKAADGSDLIDVVIVNEQVSQRVPLEPKAGDKGWQAAGGAGGSSPGQVILNVKVDTAKKPTNTTAAASIDPVKFSPGVSGKLKRPDYVSLIENPDILQSRSAVFDLSGVLLYAQGTVYDETKDPPTPSAAFKNIKQLTINGRIFALNDAIGDPEANKLVGRSAGKHLTEFVEDIEPVINFETNAAPAEDSYVNQGYYRELVADGTGFKYAPGKIKNASVKTGIPKFDTKTGEKIPGQFLTYSTYQDPPTLEDVTGIPDNQVSIVNSKFKHSQPARVPGLPVATTAEEWILINNSDIGHPFHIHINPFLVTEVGQLTHDTKKGWYLNKSKLDASGAGTGTPSPFDWVVGQWWDTILLPPHGYVKFRYWFNVPQQTEDLGPVKDNQNIEGIWVYHCHILRHEDRGMMMVVETQKNISPDQAREDAQKARAEARRSIRGN